MRTTSIAFEQVLDSTVSNRVHAGTCQNDVSRGFYRQVTGCTTTGRTVSNADMQVSNRMRSWCFSKFPKMRLSGKSDETDRWMASFCWSGGQRGVMAASTHGRWIERTIGRHAHPGGCDLMLGVPDIYIGNVPISN